MQRVLVEEHEKILEMNGDDGYSNACVHMLLDCTHTNDYNRVMLHMFHYNEKQHGEGNGNCSSIPAWESIDRGAGRPSVHGVTKESDMAQWLNSIC